MKKITIGIVCASLLATTTACSDFLEEKPKTEMSISQYYKAPEHAQAAVNKLYSSGVPEFVDASSAHNAPKASYGAYLSGFYDNEFKGMNVIVQHSQALSISALNISIEMDNIWDGCYTAIARTNTAIKYIPETPLLDESEMNILLGQAKFFRAINYFHLVKTYGDVPLITEPYESLENLYVTRASTEDVYKQIISDLIDAASVLKNESYTKNGFRITKGAAETVLANVYLNMSGYPLKSDNYANAANAARSVITAGKHALIANGNTPETSAYNMIRTLDDSNEYIYSREYQAGISDNGWRPVYCFPNNISSLSVLKYSNTNNIYRPIEALLNVYDPENDLRIQEKQFFHTTFTYTKDGKETTVKFDHPSPYIWYEEAAVMETGKGSKDYAIYRYAEVLLIAAEAIAQSEGVTAEAVGYLADVRSRAYTKQSRADIINSLSGLSKEAFTQEVWTERIRELMLEDKLWNDIQRTRMYPVTSDTDKGKVTYMQLIGARNPWGAVFSEKHLLWPISNNERQRNPNLTQNPGY